MIEQSLDQGLSEQFSQKLKVKDAGSQGTQRAIEDGLNESKANKARKIKLREVKGETQTSKQYLVIAVSFPNSEFLTNR